MIQTQPLTGEERAFVNCVIDKVTHPPRQRTPLFPLSFVSEWLFNGNVWDQKLDSLFSDRVTNLTDWINVAKAVERGAAFNTFFKVERDIEGKRMTRVDQVLDRGFKIATYELWHPKVNFTPECNKRINLITMDHLATQGRIAKRIGTVDFYTRDYIAQGVNAITDKKANSSTRVFVALALVFAAKWAIGRIQSQIGLWVSGSAKQLLPTVVFSSLASTYRVFEFLYDHSGKILLVSVFACLKVPSSVFLFPAACVGGSGALLVVKCFYWTVGLGVSAIAILAISEGARAYGKKVRKSVNDWYREYQQEIMRKAESDFIRLVRQDIGLKS